MDALTFGSTILLRNLTASEARSVMSTQAIAWSHTCAGMLPYVPYRKLPVREINLDRILLELSMDQNKVTDRV